MIQIRHVCDRCKNETHIDGPGPESLDVPEGWETWDGNVYLCPSCVAQVHWFIAAGPMEIVGHFRRSSSGKKFTGLPLRDGGGEGWQPVYATRPGPPH